MNRRSTEAKDDIKLKAALTAAFLLALVILYLLAGIFFGFFIPCPLRTITGFRCPGCGLSHAACDLARLDFHSAFRDNALFIPIFSYIIYVFVRTYIPILSNKKDPLPGKSGERIDMIFLAVILIWWIVRNILGI